MKLGRKKGPVTVKSAGIILLISGILLALFPFIETLYFNLNSPENPQCNIIQPEREKEITSMEEPDSQLPDRLIPLSGRLVISRLDLELEVNYGVDEDVLKAGPGFYPQSGYPDTGNVSIAGHRNTHGCPFWHLDKLESGDEIQLYYNDKNYNYKVDKVYVTHNRDWSVVQPTDTPALTLTTCHPLKPIGGAYDRLIVRAYMSGKQGDASVAN